MSRYEERIEQQAARIKELQDLIDKPPEEADWVADYHLLQSALDGPIIDAARKWHAAYRKAQNSNLMRAKEVERLRSERDYWRQLFQNIQGDRDLLIERCPDQGAGSRPHRLSQSWIKNRGS